MEETFKYIHHGKEVTAIDSVFQKHKVICLCWNECKYFKPNSPDNCEIAQANYELDVKFNLITPVIECAKYEVGE